MSLRLLVFILLAGVAGAAETLESAIALYREKRFPEARVALEAVLAATPDNAVACHFLGLTLLRRADDKALDDAVPWLDKAVRLAPDNAEYLADLGGTLLLLAAKNTSYAAATRGRDAMEKSLRIEPRNVEARAGLMQFYQRAPWPLGSKAKAAAQLEEIRKLDPTRALVLSVALKAAAKDYDGAFRICEELLAREPDNFGANYQLGRTAAESGRNLERGLACLERCLNLPPGGPSNAQPTDVWNRIGDIQRQRGRIEESRAAYTAALRLNPGNRVAAESLAKLK